MTPSLYVESHRIGLVDLVRAVAAQGGAVGWLAVPEPHEVHTWLDGLLASGAQLVVAERDGTVLACGALRTHAAPVLRILGEVTKVMTHPAHRGQGAARAVMELLLDVAQRDGLEVLMLACRGNNHGAQALYAGLGFVVTGRRPDVIAVGDERFDEVLMHRDLRVGTQGLVRHGSRREGPGRT